jgi:crotonobetainyl-CoA:carnitine CoA-transferase CaiB-like acyl-CoA transferase
MTAPLEGIVVVAFEQAVAAPYCTRMLADLGARVIKIEQPGRGDFTRYYDDVVHGQASHFVWLNRGKQSLSLDCKSPESAAILDKLLERADVVVQNLAPGAAERIGVAAAQLRDRFPYLVAVDLSGYGSGGPLDHRRAYDLLVQAEAGACAVTGFPGAPAKPGPPVADVGTGLAAAVSILAALHARSVSGEGSAVEIGMFDVVTDFLGFALIHSKYTGADRPPNGMSSPVVAPYGAYPTADGQLVVLGTTNDQEWQRLSLTLLARPDLAEDTTLATNATRCEQRQRIDMAIAEWTCARPIAEILAAADACGIGAAKYNSISEVIRHPQLTERGRWTKIDTPNGPVSTIAPPYTNNSWAAPAGAVPGLGEHTDAILAELGYDSTAVTELRARRAV